MTDREIKTNTPATKPKYPGVNKPDRDQQRPQPKPEKK